MAEAAAPAAPVTAPAPSNEAPAPKSAEAAPPKPQADPFDEILGKSPLSYKANGREQVIKDAATLRRKLANLDGVEHAQGEAVRMRQEAKALEDAVADFKSGDPRKAKAALAKLLGDEGKARQVLEQAVWEELQAEQAAAKLTPEQRQARDETERLRRENEEFKAKAAEQARKEAEAKEAADVERLSNELSGATLETLKALKVPASVAPWMMRVVAPAIMQGLKAGLPFEAAQAQAMEQGQAVLRELAAALLSDGPDGLDFLPDKGAGFVGKMRKRDLEQLAKQGLGGPAVVSPVVTQPKAPDAPGPRRGRWDLLDELERKG